MPNFETPDTKRIFERANGLVGPMLTLGDGIERLPLYSEQVASRYLGNPPPVPPLEKGGGARYCGQLAADGVSTNHARSYNDIDRPQDLRRIRDDMRFKDVFTGRSLISVIIPALNEEELLGRTLSRALGTSAVEVIVADAGSRDATCRIAAKAGAKVVSTAGGRGSQLNAGAALAAGRILLFLHADTLLPLGYADCVRRALVDPYTVGGAFRFRTDGAGIAMRAVELLANFRSVSLSRPYGDQGLFLEKRVFGEVGGFAALPIMEDFEFIGRLCRRGRVVTLREAAVTSRRRWRRLGVLRALLYNQLMILGFAAGLDPHRLARFYRRGGT